MALTNESHHFLCYVLPNEPQPNLYFHPYIGTYLIYAWCLALIAARTAVLYRRSRPSGKKRGLSAFFEPLALLAFCAPYTAASFWVKWELIELSAGVFFLEAVSWELFIYLGLIPVNTQYRAVFDRSTAGMQIVSEDGRPIVRSASAPVLTEAQFSALRQNRHGEHLLRAVEPQHAVAALRQKHREGAGAARQIQHRLGPDTIAGKQRLPEGQYFFIGDVVGQFVIGKGQVFVGAHLASSSARREKMVR